jgi:phosphatidylserine decarboxylase
VNGRRAFFVATEGIPFLLAMALITAATWYFGGSGRAAVAFALLVYLYLIFHDPQRAGPSVALGVMSPVDGKVVAVSQTEEGVLEGQAQRITVRVNSLGTYTARSPVEGKIMDLHGVSREGSLAEEAGGLWVLTDEGESVVLRFHGNRFGIAPRAFMRYGERVGQGQRCAYLRLTKFADIELPADSRILVTPGQRLKAGQDVLARLPSR